MSFDFSEGFFSLLRALHEDKNFNRLNFVLLGVFLDSDLVKNVKTSPLTNIAVQIKLKGFTYEEALPLAGGLAEKTNNPQELLKFILEWTGGQPFLTQKLCLLVVKELEDYIPGGNEKAWLDNLVRTEIIVNWEEKDAPEHLRTIQDRILYPKTAIELLKLYQIIIQGKENSTESTATENQVIEELLLTGLVVRRYGKLEVANKIYGEIFNQEWIEKHLPSSVADYSQLRNLLADQKWKEADEETAKLMFKIANREIEGWLRVEDIEQFPITDLQTIDKLWVEYSNGRFGFSVQKQIYQDLGGTKEFNQKITEAFWQKVGLVVNNKPYWSEYNNLTFDISAPLGHLPIRYDIETPASVFGVVEELLSHPGLVFQKLETNQESIPPQKLINVEQSVTNLSQWLNNIFDSGWQMVEDILEIKETELLFAVRSQSNPRVIKAKKINLGKQDNIRMVVDVMSISNNQRSIIVSVYPSKDRTYLPLGLKFDILDSSGEFLQQKQLIVKING
ncbi:DUF1822 family protein [Okeania sp. KiyG1]|uniref:DUF1822 family protein n=1 Tax=Okeania sp. KiyG1 TaxID=2720165 RepID=UPI001F3D85D0|nr:DUF1822 family protein [Okeania sp. KiyG1]